MSLPYIYAHPESADEWSTWGFNHAANHYDWVAQIQSQKGVQIDRFVLDPVDPNDLGMWLYNHQVMHDQVNAVLGTQGFNLLSLDLQDPNELAMWLRLNGDEHVRISAALGVG